MADDWKKTVVLFFIAIINFIFAVIILIIKLITKVFQKATVPVIITLIIIFMLYLFATNIQLPF